MLDFKTRKTLALENVHYYNAVENSVGYVYCDKFTIATKSLTKHMFTWPLA